MRLRTTMENCYLQDHVYRSNLIRHDPLIQITVGMSFRMFWAYHLSPSLFLFACTVSAHASRSQSRSPFAFRRREIVGCRTYITARSFGLYPPHSMPPSRSLLLRLTYLYHMTHSPLDWLYGFLPTPFDATISFSVTGTLRSFNPTSWCAVRADTESLLMVWGCPITGRF
jgi:hypothetical protein